MRRVVESGLLMAVGAAVVALALSLVGAFDGGRPDRAPAFDPADVPLRDGIEVEVLNAAGVSGLAARATRHLRDRGIDVVFYGNAERFGRDSTLVIDRVGDPRAARRVARALGTDLTASEPDSSRYVTVTVLLGADWRPGSEPTAGAGTGGGLRALWRKVF